MEWNTRTKMILGDDAAERLNNANVLLFGVGGVGSYAAEALIRAGIGNITLVDGDTVSETNLNRQLCALRSTIGRPKAEVMRDRMLDINPSANVTVINKFYTPDNDALVDFSEYNYVLDAVDMVIAKLHIAERCAALGIPLIASMGTGNKLDPSQFSVCDISKTHNCPLARKIRKELRYRGINHLTVVFSPEEPVTPSDGEGKVGSVSFVPGAAGLMLAGHVIRQIAEGKA